MEEEQSGGENVLVLKKNPTTGLDNLIPIARRFEKELADTCNRKFKGGGVQAAIVGTILLRDIMISLTKKIHKPGSAEGREYIEKVYESTKKDALLDWDNLCK